MQKQIKNDFRHPNRQFPKQYRYLWVRDLIFAIRIKGIIFLMAQQYRTDDITRDITKGFYMRAYMTHLNV